jgi:bifunctional DNase/RNase
MIRVTVDSIRISLLTQHRVVVLREPENRRYLPIWIGPFEADAIAMALQGHEAQRPMTHDLLKTVIAQLGASISRVLVSDVSEGTFYARIEAERDHQMITLDARPSDAIALAVRCDTPIFVATHVLDQAGVLFDDEEAADGDADAAAPPAAPAAAALPASEPEPSANPAPPAASAEEGLSLFRDFINTLDLDDDERRKNNS